MLHPACHTHVTPRVCLLGLSSTNTSAMHRCWPHLPPYASPHPCHPSPHAWRHVTKHLHRHVRLQVTTYSSTHVENMRRDTCERRAYHHVCHSTRIAWGHPTCHTRAATLGLVASSTRYTSPLNSIPLLFAMAISHVRLVEYPSLHPVGSTMCCVAAAVSSGYRMPLSPAIPQQGTSDKCTLSAHMPANCTKLPAMPIFFELHGTCTATCSRTFENSNLSAKNSRINSTGSYRENRSAGSFRAALI